MSRKTIFGVLAVVEAILLYFATQFGLSINATAIIGAITLLATYISVEAYQDYKRVTSQSARFKDPAFWTALISQILLAVNEAFELSIPVELIVGLAALILGFFFKTKKD
jgi:hypothetical protein